MDFLTYDYNIYDNSIVFKFKNNNELIETKVPIDEFKKEDSSFETTYEILGVLDN